MLLDKPVFSLGLLQSFGDCMLYVPENILLGIHLQPKFRATYVLDNTKLLTTLLVF